MFVGEAMKFRAAGACAGAIARLPPVAEMRALAAGGAARTGIGKVRHPGSGLADLELQLRRVTGCKIGCGGDAHCVASEMESAALRGDVKMAGDCSVAGYGS